MRVLLRSNFLPHLALLSSVLTGCTRVPSLDNNPLDAPLALHGAKILVLDVVRRVKCELYLATKDHLPRLKKRDDSHKEKSSKEPKKVPFDKKDPKFWFSKWDATVKLELVLNDQAGVAPGLTLNTPLVNGYNFAGGPSSVPLNRGTAFTPMVASIPQSFNFGLGGGASTQGYRTDDVQFTVSLSELVDEFDVGRDKQVQKTEYLDCTEEGNKLPENAFLDSNLGLKEWVDSALGPAEPPWLISSPEKVYKENDFRYLTEGIHPAVSAAGPSLQKATTPKPPAAVTFKAGLIPTIKQVEDETKKAREKLSVVRKALQILENNFVNVVEPISKKVESQPALCPLVEKKAYTNFQNQAQALYDASDVLLETVEAAINSNKLINDDDSNKGQTGYMTVSQGAEILGQVNEKLKAIIDQINEADAEAKRLSTAYKKCPIAKVPPPKPQKDPPIDNLTHQVQFIVATNANATPSWTFVRVKTNASPMLSISHSYTQTLSIVLAPPSGGKAPPSAEQQLVGMGFASTLNRLLGPP